MNIPFPPPLIVNDGLKIVETDYYGGPWERAGIPFMSTHMGVMRILCPWSPWREMLEVSFEPPWIVTRGNFPCGCEAIEVFCPKPEKQSFYILPAQANRLPGDPKGKRPWEIEFWFHRREWWGPHKRFPVAWRSSPLPCLLPWKGWFPDPHAFPPRKDKRPETCLFELGKPYKKGRRPPYERPIEPPHPAAWRWTPPDQPRTPGNTYDRNISEYCENDDMPF